MTRFAVICAAIFPGIHVGRFWMAWYLAPMPNNWAIWQNFRSPLMWDVFAVSTYFTVSVLFWYTGLVPDLATLRDRATTKIKKFLFGIFALGWRGSNRNWRHYEMAYLLLAGLSTPLVLSVHSVVSFAPPGGTGGLACFSAIAFRRNFSGSNGAAGMYLSSFLCACA